MRTVQAQIKHMQIRSIFLKITQTTFFVICLMNGAYILLEVCWSLTPGQHRFSQEEGEAPL